MAPDRDRGRRDLEEEVARRTAQLEDANARLRAEIETREQGAAYREAIAVLRQRVWAMERGGDLPAVVDAVKVCLQTASVDFAGYGVNLVEQDEAEDRLTQYQRGPQGSHFYRVRNVSTDSLVSRFWRQGRIVYRRDLEREDPYGELAAWASQGPAPRRSVVDVPFAHGTLGINSLRPDAFSEADLRFFEEVGEVLEEAMRRWSDLEALEASNAQLARQAEADRTRAEELARATALSEEKDRLLATFHETAKTLLGSLDVDGILDTLSREAIERGTFRSVMIALVDEEARQVRIVRGVARNRMPDGSWSTERTQQQYVGTVYDLDDANVTAEVARTGRLVVTGGWDERYDPRFRSEAHTDRHVAYFVPVSHLDHVVAVMATGSYVEEKEEMLRQIEALQPFFDLVAIALHHAHLYADLQERERQLRESQKMEIMGSLTAGIAHNFNNLLQVVTGNLDLALEQIHGPERQWLVSAREVSDSQARLVHQLMAYSRRGLEPERTPTDPSHVVDRVVRMCRQTFDRRIELTLRTEADLPAVTGDATLLEQVVLNLCLNARDAVAGTDEPRILIEASRAQGSPLEVRLRVTDNGAGMDAEVRDRAFDPFFTTKDVGQGTGLGLSIVQGIVHQHQGRVVCESEPDHGTTVDVLLPAATERPASDTPPKDAAKAAKGGGTETILVVEDEEEVRLVLTRTLERRGYRVLSAADGVEGLEVLEREGRVDLMLLDLSMPRLTGGEVLRRLAPETAPPVILLTGYAPDPDIAEGAVAMLEKPIGPRDLLDCVREILDAAEG